MITGTRTHGTERKLLPESGNKSYVKKKTRFYISRVGPKGSGYCPSKVIVSSYWPGKLPTRKIARVNPDVSCFLFSLFHTVWYHITKNSWCVTGSPFSFDVLWGGIRIAPGKNETGFLATFSAWTAPLAMGVDDLWRISLTNQWYNHQRSITSHLFVCTNPRSSPGIDLTAHTLTLPCFSSTFRCYLSHYWFPRGREIVYDLCTQREPKHGTESSHTVKAYS